MSESISNALGRVSREQALRDVAWVAEFLGVSKSWVYQATASGRLPCIRIGALVRFDPAVIKGWVKGEEAPQRINLPGCR
jgi:excisionase family DNA binding protein